MSEPPEATSSTLAREVALLDAALAAVRRGEAASALRILDVYDRRFPGGTLASEAQVARIEATFAHGEHAKARALIEAFLAAHPDSPLAQRVRSLRDR